MEIWTGVTDAWLTDRLTTLKDRATQLLLKYKSGALVTQSQMCGSFWIQANLWGGATSISVSIVSPNLNERKFRNLQEGGSRLIKWKCVGSSKTGFKSLCRVTVRWKGQKLTNIEPLSSGQRLVDKAAIRFLCRQLPPRQAEAPEQLLHLMEPASCFSPEASNHFHYLLTSPDSSSMLWLNLWRFMKAGNWK